MYAKELREKLGRLSADMHAIINIAKADKDRALTSAEAEKWDALEADFSATEKSIERAEKTEKISNNLGTMSRDAAIAAFPVTAESRERNSEPHAKAFSAYLRHGVTGLNPAQMNLLTAGPAEILNAAQSTTTTAGGYLVPSGFEYELDKAMLWFGGIEGTVRRLSTSTGNALPWPTVNDTSNKGRIIGQNVQVINTGVAFGQVNFGAFIGSSDLVLIPLALAQDSAFDLDTLAAQLLGERLGRLFNYECTLGGGTTEPTGIVPSVLAAGNTVALSTVAAITTDELTDLEFAVNPAYRDDPDSAYMMSDGMLKVIRKLKDGDNRPLWQAGLTASFQTGAQVNGYKPTINNHPYIINSDMVTPAASVDSILFGKMSKFIVRDVKDTTVIVMRERYADYLQVGYVAFRRFDSNLVDAGTHPIALGIQHA